jgi:hypothetical protein
MSVCVCSVPVKGVLPTAYRTKKKRTKLSSYQAVEVNTFAETSKLPHFLENRLTDVGEVFSLSRRPAALYPQEGSRYSFLLEAESTPGP